MFPRLGGLLIHVKAAPVSGELLAAEHAETMEAGVVSLLLLLLQHLLLQRKTRAVRKTLPPLILGPTSAWITSSQTNSK